MNFFRHFRRPLLLLLSLTFSMQAMAVASLGACHRAKALASAEVSVTSSHQSHGDMSAHHAGKRTHGDDGANAATGGHSQDNPSQDASRVKCAACAACHLCNVVLTTATINVDIPAVESTFFPESSVPRVRNVANGLERPPRA
jgi:hypothetical protein